MYTHFVLLFNLVSPFLRQVEHRVELYKQANTVDDLLAGTSSLKRRRLKRNSRLNKAEKKLLLPAKRDSSDGEDCDDSESGNMSVDEEVDEPDDGTKDSGDDIIEVASPVRSRDSHTSSITEDQTTEGVYIAVDKTASSPRHNATHERTVKSDRSENETSLAKDGQNSCQEIGKSLEQQMHAYYVSVERLPEIQVNEVHFLGISSL